MSMCTRTLWFYIQKNSIAQLSTTCSSEEEKNCLLNSGKYLRYLLLEVKKKLRWGNTSLILYKDVSFHTQEHNPGFKKMYAASSKKQLEGWRDGSALRSTYSSCRVPKSHSQYLCQKPLNFLKFPDALTSKGTCTWVHRPWKRYT